MKLVMFDMDGTLTDSLALDENCYVRATEAELGLQGIVADWESYTHASSSYCLEQMVRQARGSHPTTAESHAIQQRMVHLMEEIARKHGRCTREIAGAAQCVRQLIERGYAVAIASGDWERTARHKLEAAGIPFASLPSAFCDVSHVRTEIMLTASARAQSHYGCSSFERIVYVGDGVWDVKACRELDWPLIGVGSGEPAQRLRELGVADVIDGYVPFERFHTALERARPPRECSRGR